MRSLIFNVLFYSVTFCTAAVALAASIFGGRRTMWWFVGRHCKNILWLTRNILGIKLEIRGLERFENGARPQLIVSKHQSELDVFPPVALYPDVGAIVMEELSRYPLIGPAMRKLDHILVSVEGARREQLAQVVSGAKRMAEQGRPILIYPEGELMRLGARERYRSGVFHIYRALGCEATPVALSTGLAWPKREWFKYPGQKCTIEFMEPIPPGLEQEAFMLELEKRIEGRCMALIRQDGAETMPERVAEAERIHRLGLTNSDDAPARPPIPGLTGPADATPDPTG